MNLLRELISLREAAELCKFSDDQVEVSPELTAFTKAHSISFKEAGAHGLVTFEGTRENLEAMVKKFWGEPDDYLDEIEPA